MYLKVISKVTFSLQFPNFIHTQKRNPKTHLKDPDMFWDFISLHPPTTHQVYMIVPHVTKCEKKIFATRVFGKIGVNTESPKLALQRV